MLHNEAMDLALRGDIAAKDSGPTSDESIALYTEAFEKEREAALLAGLPAGSVSFVSHSEAFAHFVLMQQKDLYSNSAARQA